MEILDGYIGKDIRIVSNLMKRKMAMFRGDLKDIEDKPFSHHCCLAKKDMTTPMQGLFIGYIAENREHGDVFQKDIENTFSIRRSTATEILKLMEKNGLIKKESVDYDARLKKLILTEKAEQLHKNVKTDLDKLETVMMKGITDEEKNTLIAILSKVKKNLEEE